MHILATDAETSAHIGGGTVLVARPYCRMTVTSSAACQKEITAPTAELTLMRMLGNQCAPLDWLLIKPETFDPTLPTTITTLVLLATSDAFLIIFLACINMICIGAGIVVCQRILLAFVAMKPLATSAEDPATEHAQIRKVNTSRQMMLVTSRVNINVVRLVTSAGTYAHSSPGTVAVEM